MGRDQSNPKVLVSLLLCRDTGWYFQPLHLYYRIDLFKPIKITNATAATFRGEEEEENSKNKQS